MMDIGEFLLFAEIAGLKSSSSPSKSGIVPGSPETFLLVEGDFITVKPGAATTGLVQQYGSNGSLVKATPVTANQNITIGPFSGTSVIVITTTAGSIDTMVGDAVLGAATVRAGGNLADSAGKRIGLRPAGVSGISRELGFTWQGQNTGAGVTVVNQRPALGPYRAVRVHYANHDTSPWTVTAAKAAAAPTHQNDGTGLSWASLTFTDAGTNVVPAGVGGSAPDAIPSFLSSDVLYQGFTPRTDDPTKQLLHQFRTYSAGTQNILLLPNGTDAQNYNASAYANGRQYAGRSPAGDLVTTITASSPLEINAWQHPAIVEFFYDSPAQTNAFVGDSLMQGKGSTIDNCGWPLQLVNLLQARNSGVLQSLMNFGTSSQTYSATCTIAKKVISQFKPDRLFMCGWTPNNNPTSDSVMLDCRARLLEVAQVASRNGVLLVICTSGPVNAYNAAADARIKAQNAWLRQMAAAGAWALAEMATVLENPANPGQILPAYDSGDGTHYSNAGYGAMASAAAMAI